MNKLIVLSLVCLLAFVSVSSANEKTQAIRDLARCGIQNCRPQVIAAKGLFKADLDRCLGICGAPGRELSLLSDEELKELKGCFQQNNCRLPLQHLKANGDKPQVQALKACAAQNCGPQVAKVKALGIGRH